MQSNSWVQNSLEELETKKSNSVSKDAISYKDTNLLEVRGYKVNGVTDLPVLYQHSQPLSLTSAYFRIWGIIFRRITKSTT